MPRVKGQILRVWAKGAERAGLLSRVEGRLSPAALAVLRNPPLAGSWVDSQPLNDLFIAIHDGCGREAALKLARDTTKEIAPFYTSMLSGLLRLLGTSPASLFSRLNDTIKQTMEGVEYRWVAKTERSGSIEIIHPATSIVNHVQFLSVVPTFELMFQLCKVKGTISEPAATGERSTRFDLAW